MKYDCSRSNTVYYWMEYGLSRQVWNWRITHEENVTFNAEKQNYSFKSINLSVKKDMWIENEDSSEQARYNAYANSICANRKEDTHYLKECAED